MDKRKKWKNPSGTNAYYAWRNMVRRCLNPSCREYKNYGGRGITVCDEWVRNYDKFFEDMGAPEGRLTLERIDNSKGYFKDNCAWVTYGEQSVNKRTNRFIEIDGVKMTIAHWADSVGLHRTTVYKRLDNMGLSSREAVDPSSRRPQSKCGTVHSYQKGCRCRPCKDANNKKAREQRMRRKGYDACAGELSG